MQNVMEKAASFVLAVSMGVGITCAAHAATVEYAVGEAADYYAGITAISGDALLGQVHDLITTTHRYYSSYNDCKDPTIITKTDAGSSSQYVMDFYSQADISSTWGSGANGTWNREHVWCQSLSNSLWGTSGGGSDLHHLRPTETKLNAVRGNLKYGEITTSKTLVYYWDSNGKPVADGGYTGNNTFEPLDQVKGDIARIVMYVYTHYNTYTNLGGSTNGSGSAGYFGTLNFTHIMAASNEDAAISILLKWNEEDPVDEIETARNDAVYAIQGNRNPFIDHPEYAEAIWGDESLNEGGGEEIGGGETGGEEVGGGEEIGGEIGGGEEIGGETGGETGGEDDNHANAVAFCNAVAAINDTTLDGFFSSLNKAINAYRNLSEADRLTVSAEIETLQEAIDEYNERVKAYNALANVSEEIALGGLGG